MNVINDFSLNDLGIFGLLITTTVVLILSAVIYILFRPLNRIRVRMYYSTNKNHLQLIYNLIVILTTTLQDLCDIGYEEHTRLDTYGRTRRQVANDVRRRKKIGEIPPIFPNGWFVLCESDDVKNGQVRAVDALGSINLQILFLPNQNNSLLLIFILGENFVVFRTEDGVACILDAYCPHLGAHLGVGSRVVGDCVECPFHGWKFRGQDGQCTSIPYTTGKRMQNNLKQTNMRLSLIYYLFKLQFRNLLGSNHGPVTKQTASFLSGITLRMKSRLGKYQVFPRLLQRNGITVDEVSTK